MDRNSQFFTVMHNRTCEQTNLMGFFDPAGYGRPGCPMFYRSARIDRPADQPVNPDRMENSADSSATRTARHGLNRHSSGIFTFFSLEEGSNFVQNIRHDRTSFKFCRESFFIAFFDQRCFTLCLYREPDWQRVKLHPLLANPLAKARKTRPPGTHFSFL